MVAFFGPSQQELERLRSTVQSLGTTSVPGLAAALSVRERKAEKLLAYELARPDTPIVYEPSRRVVRWALLPPPPPVAEPAPTTPPEPVRAPRAPPPVFTTVGLKTLCPHCHVPLQSTGSESLAVCPQCGRLSSARETRSAESPVPTTSSPPPATSTSEGTLSLDDRRSQELFAAYVSAKPIPCPKCRTPLRHRALSEYVCPSCGQTVRFPKAGEARAPPVVTPPA